MAGETYHAWSVVYGETPSATKWNYLGENDAGLKNGELIDDGAIISDKLADAAKLASALTNTPAGRIAGATIQAAINELDDEKPHMVRRRGGSSSNWSTPGATAYNVIDAVIQCGAISAAAAQTKSVTFATAFSQTPNVLCQILNAVVSNYPIAVRSVTTSGFSFYNPNANGTTTVMWWAIGK